MLTGCPPYYDHDKEILMYNIINNSLEIPSNLSKNANDLLTKLLEKDPSKRIGFFEDSEEIKAHPWFESVNWNDVQLKRVTSYYPYLLKSKDELLHGISSSKYLHFIIRVFKT